MRITKATRHISQRLQGEGQMLEYLGRPVPCGQSALRTGRGFGVEVRLCQLGHPGEQSC